MSSPAPFPDVLSNVAALHGNTRRRSSRGAPLILSAVALFALAMLILALVWKLNRTQDQKDRKQWWRAHTLNVLIDAERIDTALHKALRGEREYVLTGQPGARADFERGLSDYRATATEWRRMTRDNAAQQRRLRIGHYRKLARPYAAEKRHGTFRDVAPKWLKGASVT